MRMKREGKKEEIKRIREDLMGSKASFLLDFRGLKVAELTEFRKLLRKEGAKFHVVKNSLARLAIEGTELRDLDKFLTGCTGIIFAESNSTAAAKIIKRFSKDHSHLVAKGGVLGKDVLMDDEVRRLGDLPPKKDLLAQTLAELQLPLRGLLGVLSAPLNDLVFLLNSVLEKKKETYQ